MSEVDFSPERSGKRALDQFLERADDIEQLFAEAAFEAAGASIQPPDAEGRYILAPAGPGLAQGVRAEMSAPGLDDAIADGLARKLQEGD